MAGIEGPYMQGKAKISSSVDTLKGSMLLAYKVAHYGKRPYKRSHCVHLVADQKVLKFGTYTTSEWNSRDGEIRQGKHSRKEIS